MTRFQDCGLSTSSSNSGSTTPAKEKTPEEIAAEEEAAKKAAEEAEAKKNEELAQRDYESEVKYPANNGSGKKVAFANPARVAVAVLGTTSTVSKDYSEVELKNNIEYDYASGKFFDASKPMDPTATKVVRELDEANFFVSVNGKYFQLEDVNGAHALTPDVIFAGVGSGVDGYDNALAADDAMLIRKTDASTANNKNTGFINTTLSKVTSEEAVAEGINLKYWTKGADGYWYPIVTDEKEAYKKTDLVTAANPQGWNYKTNAAGEIQWHYTAVAEGWRVPNVFVRRGTQNVDTFVITEKGSLRKVTDETATNNGKDVYANTFLASVPGLYGYTTISEAGKDGFKDALARNAAFVDESKAMFFGVGAAADILGYKDKNDVNVGQINNEFFNVKPAEGYFLDYNRNAAAVWPEGGVAGVGNYLYTDDYKAACDFNSRDYMVLNGKIVKKTPYNFTADEEKEARYVKDGYLRYQGSYYKIIAEKATSNNNWLPSTYVYKNAYNSAVFCVYDNTKTYTWEQASVAGTELEVLPGYVKVDVGAYGAGINATLGAFIGALPAGALKTELQAKYATTGNDENLSNRYYYFKEVTVSAKPAGGYNNEVFDLADDNDVEWTKQYTVNGRFYLTK